MKDPFYLAGEDMGMNFIPVMNIDTGNKLQDDQLPNVLPILPLRNAVLFPDTVIPIPVRREKSIQLLNEAYKSNKLIGAVAQRDPKTEDPVREDLFATGTLGRIVKIIDLPNVPVTAIIQGVRRMTGNLT
ncbi:MAG: LON peptidase substrate-binding domain-containing protein [Bacteroidales bacterium]|nr:LON peptidase substrate-binding domain-containing protein [Bacteroidales bacterium]